MPAKLKHGGSGTRIYQIWKNMCDRCYKADRKDYPRYGGRGISVCREWLSFPEFRVWSESSGYGPGLELDRENRNGNYSPDNCRWATRLQQMGNTSRCILVTAFGETKTIRQWTMDGRCRVGKELLAKRVRSGMDHEVAITQEHSETTKRQLATKGQFIK